MHRLQDCTRLSSVVPELHPKHSKHDAMWDERLLEREDWAESIRPLGNESLFLEDSAARYRRFFMEMSEGAAILDAGIVIRQVNRRLAKILGASREELSGILFSDRISPTDRGIFDALFQKAWEGRPARNIVHLQTAGGSPILALLSLSLLPGEIRKNIAAIVLELSPAPRMQFLLGEPEKDRADPPETGGGKTTIPQSPSTVPHGIQNLHPTHFRGVGMGRNAPAKAGTSLNLASDVDTRPTHTPVRNLFPGSVSEIPESDGGLLDPESRRQALERVLLAPPRQLDRHASAAIFPLGETQTLPTFQDIDRQNAERATLLGDMPQWEMKVIGLPGQLPDRRGKPVAYLPEWKPKALLPGVPKDNPGILESLLLPKRQLKKNQL